jgi:hypothetical protein
MNNTEYLKTEDWVEVRFAEEIAKTLDSEGTLDGLPFMPEMVKFCGKRFRVLRRAEKACVEFPGGAYKIREFSVNDIVLLEGLRCSGADHDGCQRGCLVFWRTAWLRRVPNGQFAETPGPEPQASLLSKLRTKTEPDRYFCQSTEMAKITRPQSRTGILSKIISDIRSGSRGLPEMARLVLGPIWRRLTRRFINRTLTGTQTKTPAGKLDLQPGEFVAFKSTEEIAQTLDNKGRNRGLLVDANALRRFRDGCYRVRTRIDRMINEANGQMCSLNNTVVLEDVSCTCHSVVGGCPRQDPVFWREIWLKRVSQDRTPSGEPAMNLPTPDSPSSSKIAHCSPNSRA